MDDQLFRGGFRQDELPAVFEERGAQQAVVRKYRPPRPSQPVRLDPFAVQLKVGMAADAAERLSVTPPDPIGILHVRQRERLVLRPLRKGRGGDGPLRTDPGLPAEDLHPARQRRFGDHFCERDLDPGLAPPADQTHDLQGVQPEADKVVAIGKTGLRDQPPYGFADGIVFNDRRIFHCHRFLFFLEVCWCL